VTFGVGTSIVISIGEANSFNTHKTGEEKMKNLRSLFAAFTLAAVLTFGSVGANAGIIIAGATEDPCTETNTAATKDGIIIAGVTGIIIAGFTGIIIAGAADSEPTTDCGIIIAG
jgi:hypothetical protein